MQPLRFFAAALTASLPLCVLAAPAVAGGPQPQTKAAIKAENARWADAYARGDYAAIGRLYTKDGALLPPGGDRIIGGAAIAEYFVKGATGTQADTVSFSNFELYGNEQVVTEVSDTEIRNSTGKLKYRGKQILIFLKEGGVWKLHRDIWNDSAP